MYTVLSFTMEERQETNIINKHAARDIISNHSFPRLITSTSVFSHTIQLICDGGEKRLEKTSVSWCKPSVITKTKILYSITLAEQNCSFFLMFSLSVSSGIFSSTIPVAEQYRYFEGVSFSKFERPVNYDDDDWNQVAHFPARFAVTCTRMDTSRILVQF